MFTAIRLVAGKVLNPRYNAAAHRTALNEGEDYDVSREVDVDAGFVHSGPDAWVLCCPGHMNSKPVCEPGDDKTAKRVKRWMEDERPAEIANIQQLVNNVDSIKDPAEKKHIGELAKAYGLKRQGGSDKKSGTAKS